MENFDKYNFSDFTLKKYSKLLDLAQQKFTFVDYHNFDSTKPHIIWRHDIDMSPKWALRLARIEAERDIKATYFLLLHSEFYNLCNSYNRDIILEIMSLGHEIGLHFDCQFHNLQNEDDLRENLLLEKDFLENIFPQKLKTFAFHINTEFTKSCEEEKYGQMLNVYSQRMKNIPYCSDSNGHWRFNKLKTMIEKSYNLHVLTHEIWWTSEVTSPRQKIRNCIFDHGTSAYLEYVKTLRRHNLLNIDWEE